MVRRWSRDLIALGAVGMLAVSSFLMPGTARGQSSGERIARDTASCDPGMEPDFGTSTCTVTVSDGVETWTTTAIPTRGAKERRLVSEFDGPRPVDGDNDPPCSDSPRFDYTEPSTDHWMYFTIGGGWHKQIEATREVDARGQELRDIARRQEICFVAPYPFDAWNGRRIVRPARRDVDSRDDSDDNSDDDSDDNSDDSSSEDSSSDDSSSDDSTSDDSTPDDSSSDDSIPDDSSSVDSPPPPDSSDSVTPQQSDESRREYYGILPPCNRMDTDSDGYPTGPCLLRRSHSERNRTVTNIVFAPAHDQDPRPKNQTRRR